MVATAVTSLSCVCGGVHRSSQHLENDGGGPAEHQHAIHRRHRPEQPPALRQDDVAVAERRVVHKPEIQNICAVRRRVDQRVGQRPDANLRNVREASEPKTVAIMTASNRACRGTTSHEDHRRHHQGMDPDIAGTDGGAHEKLTQHIQGSRNARILAF